jgi:hypothetical protein
MGEMGVAARGREEDNIGRELYNDVVFFSQN